MIVWNFWCCWNPNHSGINYREKALRPLFQGFVSFFLSLFALVWISSSSLSVKNLANESLRVSIWVEKIDDLKDFIFNNKSNDRSYSKHNFYLWSKLDFIEEVLENIEALDTTLWFFSGKFIFQVRTMKLSSLFGKHFDFTGALGNNEKNVCIVKYSLMMILYSFMFL